MAFSKRPNLVHHLTPSKDIQFPAYATFHRGISKARRNEASSIAKGMCNELIAIIRASCREDDCVEVVIPGLKALDKGKIFTFVRRAGIVLS
ncbi:hypothetical protein CLCR_04461 [Cladophialophora carrionii]|uniref:Uncharacterized protein n=1 Tax=Cladophialophora carrionii TaxID=86049 RepID=A0A1C1CIN5_9EURO|nr:hypothetical protein CLCR_04461 [Cladophialophora carrionii]